MTPRGALDAESTFPISIVLTRATLQALKKAGTGTAKFAVSVTDSAGQTTKRTVSVKLSG